MPFTSLGLNPALLRAISEQNYLEPTAIQTAAIPAILRGEDVLASAQTGSGKTAAFSLPMLQQWLESKHETPRRVHTLILAPTRELAAQVGEAIHSLAQYLPEPLKIAVAFGGVSLNPQMMALRGGADIVVATPGRLLDLIDHNALKLSAVSTLVLDEADRLLDLGFADEIGRILALLPKQRQNLFFSATFPPDVQALAKKILHNPTRIEVESAPTTKPDILQRAIEVDSGRRTALLGHLIKEHGWNRTLVFVATKNGADRLADKLSKAGLNAVSLHGELSQGARSRVLEDFKASRLQVVIATDLAGRGIDIAQLPAVVNFDLPRSVVDYTHRIGRTGRAGGSGVAVSFISADTEAHFRLIEKRQGLRVPREQIAGFEPVEAAAPVAASVDAEGVSTGGIKGKRKSKKDKLREAAAKDS